ncbi:riboflavin synthase [Caloranaerobacter azorensis]|uniref:riboflavin synthase n=1 Tax=Caloranaerobacter azorensis TaxID=116090 RepID=UPI002022FAA9|nr:riboflavin synthase [Caloranaerobacter azorensis]
MFTGLVEEVGIVKSILKGTKSVKIVIKAKKVLEDIKIGDSISTNGVCLTVTDFTDDTFSVDVMPETMKRSNLKNLVPGSKVNLERALRLGDRLGGHLVSGHIDGTGKILSFDKEDNAVWVTIKPPEELLKYIIYKGSIAIDGISLTVAYIDNKVFKVSIIPILKKLQRL